MWSLAPGWIIDVPRAAGRLQQAQLSDESCSSLALMGVGELCSSATAAAVAAAVALPHSPSSVSSSFPLSPFDLLILIGGDFIRNSSRKLNISYVPNTETDTRYRVPVAFFFFFVLGEAKKNNRLLFFIYTSAEA